MKKFIFAVLVLAPVFASASVSFGPQERYITRCFNPGCIGPAPIPRP